MQKEKFPSLKKKDQKKKYEKKKKKKKINWIANNARHDMQNLNNYNFSLIVQIKR